jgi:hypothetical protein
LQKRKKRTATLFKLGDRMESVLEKEIYILSEGGSGIKAKIFDDGLVFLENEKKWNADLRYYATVEAAMAKKDSEGRKLENEGYARIWNDLIDPKNAIYFKPGNSAYLRIEKITACQDEIVEENGILSYKGNLLRA